MGKKILVVDDNLDVIKMVGLMLQTRGYDIIAAQSGTQALARARSDNPDLMILDIMMPDMDGYEVCKRLRADPTTANLPILMFTAKSGTSDKVAGFQAGADDFLTKPIHPDELVSRVETALMRSARRAAKEPVTQRAKIVGFLGSKGGVGTSTLALNVGVALAQELARGKQVILADMRSGMATLGLQLELHGGGMGRPAQPAGAEHSARNGRGSPGRVQDRPPSFERANRAARRRRDHLSRPRRSHPARPGGCGRLSPA